MVKTTANLSITNTVKGKLPRLPFLKLKNAILGEKYELSVVFVSPEKAKKLNLAHRGKNKPANVLSFPLSKNSGEIFLCVPEIKKSAKDFDRQGGRLVGFFFIHALVHLKGNRHGSTMEKTEEKFRKVFDI
ncbi:MAG: rRNA maturation RNase YbeY [Patescibacteria group bacterium]